MIFNNSFQLVTENPMRLPLNPIKKKENVITKMNQFLRKLFDEGIRLRNLRMYDQCNNCFSKIIELAPNNITGYNSRGFTNLCRGWYNVALDDFNICCRIIPNDKTVLLNKAKCLLQMGQLDRSSIDYQNITKIDPNDSRGFIGLGICERKRGNIKNSLKLFSKGIEIGSHKKEARFHRSLSRMMNQDYVNAINDLSILIEANNANFVNSQKLEVLRNRNVRELKKKLYYVKDDDLTYYADM